MTETTNAQRIALHPEMDDWCEHDEIADTCKRCKMTAAEVMGGQLPDPGSGHGWMVELTEAQRLSLPAEYHRPAFMGTSKPKLWICAACWGDGWTSQWPCEKANAGGVELARSLNVEWYS